MGYSLVFLCKKFCITIVINYFDALKHCELGAGCNYKRFHGSPCRLSHASVKGRKFLFCTGIFVLHVSQRCHHLGSGKRNVSDAGRKVIRISEKLMLHFFQFGRKKIHASFSPLPLYETVKYYFSFQSRW